MCLLSTMETRDASLVIPPCVGVEVRIIIRSIVHNDLVETAFSFHLPLRYLQSSEN